MNLRRLKKVLTADNAGLLLEKFEERCDVFQKRLRKARRHPTEDAVHRLRVASRRLLSLLTLLEAILPSLKVKSVRRMIKKQLLDLSKMRDVHVQILHTERLLADFPQLSPFHRFLLREERRMAKRVAKQLRNFRTRRLRKSTKRLLKTLLRSLDPDRDTVLGSNIGTAIDEAYRRVLLLRDEINVHRTASIHRTRIAFKNFRYMAEIAAPMFPELDAQRLRAMHAYQDRMGVIQDMESLLSTMMEFRRRSDRTSILVPENEVRRQRQRNIDEFMQTADEVRFFWPTSAVSSREVV